MLVNKLPPGNPAPATWEVHLLIGRAYAMKWIDVTTDNSYTHGTCGVLLCVGAGHPDAVRRAHTMVILDNEVVLGVLEKG